MTTQNKPVFSPAAMKFLFAAVLVAGVLILLSGVFINLDDRISVQSMAGDTVIKRAFTGLSEYGYIQAHGGTGVQPVKVAVPDSLAALPEYGYIASHSVAGTQTLTGLLPVGMQTLAEFGYIQAHTGSDQAVLQVALLPQGLLSLSEAGYIAAHSQASTATFSAGLPSKLRSQPIYGYLQMHEQALE